MKAEICKVAMTLLAMSCGLPELAVAQTGPNAPREPAASGAIVIPPTTGDSEAMQKAPPTVVDPRMAAPPPAAGTEAQPNTTRPQSIPGPTPDNKKKLPKPS
jgi:hypothetical protein